MPMTAPAPRAGLGSIVQSSVDAFVKTLKAHARALGALTDAHAAERALLERLFYKGRNQHGGSLLWARVREMRRYAARLAGLELGAVGARVRGEFYGDVGGAVSSKKMKGSWTHYPDSASLLDFLSRLSIAVELAEKAADSMLRVFEWTMLFVRGGEFLQMTVTLAALAARLRHLNVELTPLASEMHECVRGVFVALYPGKADGVRPLDRLVDVSVVQLLAGTPPTADALDDAMEFDEDLGVSMSHSMTPSASLPMVPALQPDPSDNRATEKALATAIAFKTPTAPTAAVVLNNKRKPAAPAAEPEKKVKKKKKAKRDEIDDIFG